jgi:hypothetical protein
LPPFSPELLSSCLLSRNIKIRICRILVLPVVTLRDEQRLRVFENRMLRIFGLKRDEVTGGLRKLHNEELHNLYTSSQGG